MFSLRLEQDFEAARAEVSRGVLEPQSDNLWHSLVGDEPPTPETIAQATAGSALLRVEPVSGWLARQRELARDAERIAVYDVLTDTARGFIESFEAVNDALLSSDAKRRGRPAKPVAALTARARPRRCRPTGRRRSSP